jgi:hypothetical protein
VKLIAKICVLGVVLWSIYWLAAGFGLRSGLSAWFDTQRKSGWQAEYASLETLGFPLRLEMRLTQPALADPATGVAWQANSLSVSSPAWWPGNVTVSFPDTPQHLSYFDQGLSLTARDAFANLHLKPGPQLEVLEMSLQAGPWGISEDAGSLVGASGLIISARQTDNPAQYKIDLSADQFRPGDLPRRAMRLLSSWPIQFDTLELDMMVTFDRPWDRSALENARPQPRLIKLKLEGNGETPDEIWGTIYENKYPRLVRIGNVYLDAIPEGSMIVIHNIDEPGVIGHIGTTLGRHDINIARFQLGRRDDRAVCLVNIDTPADDSVLKELESLPIILSIKQVHLD